MMGIILFAFGIFFVYTLRYSYDVNLMKKEKTCAQIVSVGIWLFCVGIMVHFAWDFFVESWIGIISMISLFFLIIYCTPAVLKIKYI